MKCCCVGNVYIDSCDGSSGSCGNDVESCTQILCGVLDNCSKAWFVVQCHIAA